ncbi:carbamoyltransferase HypF [Candidatus Venteria ishoeyi]|uniref:Carbamoyltransferase HypF n=1 Tax=Candidatus Venteria ishoeyi TaxID=1899563 RepID=A0A1H6F375_9GAMM|nr:carbamoyltransferase HypF [Candidatus Venteria ishoeyi]SEH04618.1 Carbamoyltransferase HypF [Candidatus Venteria ishoeyi]
MKNDMPQTALKLQVTGRVQAVGFRPFVYRIALAHQLKGWVRNSVGLVDIHVEGEAVQLAQFCEDLIAKAPPLARPEITQKIVVADEGFADFCIRDSNAAGEALIHIPPDQAMCPDCEQELLNPLDRRYRYPFTNCTQCGPRYTIIRTVPYDRKNTSMSVFPLCPPCLLEYEAPSNRRFHAEPNACPDCGPQLCFQNDNVLIKDTASALAAAVTALKQGQILAVKGVGGYHLMCDAHNAQAVQKLRDNKHRPHKPLALLLPATGADGLETVKTLVALDANSALMLQDAARPIILLPQKMPSAVAENVAPGLSELGVMLPPSPFHQMLSTDFGHALVATSANISGEPVLTDDDAVKQRLSAVVDGYLSHNRDIVRPADDSVSRLIAGKPRCIRLGRGSAPLEWALKHSLPQPVLALGGHLKNTVALAWGKRLVVSPHIGDLSAHRSILVFQQVIADLQALYQVKAEALLTDAHPQYASSRWAKAQPLPLIPISHHRAHASALAGEHGREDRGLVLTWDGVGLGDDGSLWGGEAFLGCPGDWQRVASFRPFHLAGGDKLGLEPWRSAAALHWELGLPYAQSTDNKPALALAHQAWLRRINTLPSSAVGRLFDAAAAMLGLLEYASHDGEAPMRLEALAESLETPVETRAYLALLQMGDVLRFDWEPLFYLLKNTHYSPAQRAGLLHRILANSALHLYQQLSQKHDIHWLGLAGGVFQNRLLSENIKALMQAQDVECLLATAIPTNDGGLSYGQLIEYAAQTRC